MHSISGWRRWLRLLIMVAVLAYFIFHMLQYISRWIDPFDRHDQPGGGAVKVFEQLHEGDGFVLFKDRLLFFFWYGE
jgi:hypothetical protein